MRPPQPQEHREVCYRCHKPQVVCVCPSIRPVDNRTGILILQHARERFHPFGTVRFARLGLQRAQVFVHHPRKERHSALAHQLPERAGLLYPAERAEELAELSEAERPEHLVVLDGTWPQARALYRLNPWLSHLPHYRLTPAQESRYQIRKEPSEECISTIEAIIQALKTLEPHTEGLDQLLLAFTGMIERQVEYAKGSNPRIRKKRPPRPSRALHPSLRDQPERVVLAYGEFSYLREGKQKRYQPLLWTAQRLLPLAPDLVPDLVPEGGAARFQVLIRPERMPSAGQLRHMGLAPEALQAGLSLEEARRAWARFVRPDDLVVVWNQSTRDGFATIEPQRQVVVLKEAYCNLKQQACGALEEVLLHEGLEPSLPQFSGRAGRIMAQLRPIVEGLTEGLAGQ